MATPGALPQPALPPLPHLQAVTGRRERGGGGDIMHSPHIIQANVGALAERDLEGEFLGRKHASQLTAAWKHVTVDGAPSDGGFFSARCKAKRNSQKWWAAACVCVCVCACVRVCVVWASFTLKQYQKQNMRRKQAGKVCLVLTLLENRAKGPFGAGHRAGSQLWFAPPRWHRKH